MKSITWENSYEKVRVSLYKYTFLVCVFSLKKAKILLFVLHIKHSGVGTIKDPLNFMRRHHEDMTTQLCFKTCLSLTNYCWAVQLPWWYYLGKVSSHT